MLCPRCVDKTVLVDDVGALGEAACPRCQARFLEAADAAFVLEELAGIARATLVDDAHGAPEMGPCPGCRRPMSQLVLHDRDVWLCSGCGSASFVRGALSALSHERFDEPPAAQVREGAVGVVSREPVSGEVLATAFAEARFRTAVDARAAGDRGHGLIAERATRVEADALLTALARMGVTAAMVDGEALALPRIFAFRSAVLDDEGLIADPHFGAAPLRVAWSDVSLVAVGVVRLAVRTEERQGPRFSMGHVLGRPAQSSVQAVDGHVDEVVLELLVPGARIRTSAPTLELSRARGVSVETAFRAFARDVLTRVPAAAVRAGDARALGDSSLTRFTMHRAKTWDHVVAWARWRGA